jgi:hypothetical protein
MSYSTAGYGGQLVVTVRAKFPEPLAGHLFFSDVMGVAS